MTLLLSEETLVEQSMAGDTIALEQLLLVYYPRLLRRIERRIIANNMSGRISAEDALQQAYLQAFRALPTFTPCSEGAFYGWLKTIAENVLLDAGKKKQPWPVPPPPSDSSNSSYMGLLSRIMDENATPVTESIGRELLRALHVALASLPEDCRKAIQLRYLEERPRKEVAEIMGCTENKVHHLCEKGREILRGELQRLSRFI